MKVIEATWEQRNLGIRAFEVRLEDGDSILTVREALQALSCDYTVVRAPRGRLDFYEVLMQEGFYYAETMITLSHDLRPVEVPEHKRAINDALALEPMNDEEFSYMLSRVKEGMYKTDRISLDPHFTLEQSANRYYWWLQDEWAHGNAFYKLTYQGEYVGYLDLKQISETEFQDEFTGIFPEYAGSGFAMGFTTKPIELLRSTGAEILYAEISSNNVVSLQSRMRYGYGVSSYFNVFVKHTVK